MKHTKGSDCQVFCCDSVAVECTTAREWREIQVLLQKLEHVSKFFPALFATDTPRGGGAVC